MAKHYLKLEKEMPLRDYDGFIGHATIVKIRYLFLAVEKRVHDDHRTFGSLFYARRILTLAMDKVRKSGVFLESVIMKILDAVKAATVTMLKSS